jgi:hypothetical protein
MGKWFMKIKMLCSIAGADFALSPSEETERFSVSEATRLIEAGFAVPVTETEIEIAMQPSTAEKRVKRTRY